MGASYIHKHHSSQPQQPQTFSGWPWSCKCLSSQQGSVPPILEIEEVESAAAKNAPKEGQKCWVVLALLHQPPHTQSLSFHEKPPFALVKTGIAGSGPTVRAEHETISTEITFFRLFLKAARQIIKKNKIFEFFMGLAFKKC